jgi:uncharacterized membrane protein YphA (DoxX/SURF4 family)
VRVGARVGWWTALWLILLRIAIGWHFLYEGLTKLQSYRNPSDTRPPFTAEPFLATATGPLRHWYVSVLDDPYGSQRLDKGGLTERWTKLLEDYGRRYGPELSDKGKHLLKDKFLPQADAFFADPDLQARIEEFRAVLEKVLEHERRSLAWGEWVDWGATQLEALRAQLRQTAAPLLERVDQMTRDFQKELEALVPEEQRQAAQEKPWWAFWAVQWPLPTDPLGRINLAVTYGLTVTGACLLVGLFSRLASMLAALFLISVYLAHPPWPGLPSLPGDPGHYLYVNKELIEAFAALVLAGVPTGRWVGLDALVHRLLGRRRAGTGAEPKP